MHRSLALALVLLVACSGKDSDTTPPANDGEATHTGADTGGRTGTGTTTPAGWANTFTTGDSERCILLFGDSDRVRGTDTGLPSGSDGRTLQAWVRTNNAREQVAVSHGRGAPGSGFVLGTTGGKGFISVAGSDKVVGSLEIDDDQWHHLVGAWDGVTAVLMVDGVTDAVGRLSGDTIAGSFTAGNMPEGGAEHRPWIGWLDDVKLFRAARPPDQVAADLDGDAFPNDTLVWWDFEVGEGVQGNGVEIEDVSGNGHTGVTGGVADHPLFPSCR